MRITASDARNELIVNDQIAGVQITLYYRLPTTQERLRYSQSLFQRKGNRIKYAYAEARLEWGMKILLGFSEGAFATMDEGKPVPYSSDPKAKNYRDGWKDLVREFASDLVEVLAVHVFEGASTVMPRLDMGEETPAEDEVVEKNS